MVLEMEIIKEKLRFVSYIEPHKVIIKNIAFLVFNYSKQKYDKALKFITMKIRDGSIRNINQET